jgi:hypothetical protein
MSAEGQDDLEAQCFTIVSVSPSGIIDGAIQAECRITFRSSMLRPSARRHAISSCQDRHHVWMSQTLLKPNFALEPPTSDGIGSPLGEKDLLSYPFASLKDRGFVDLTEAP